MEDGHVRLEKGGAADLQKTKIFRLCCMLDPYCLTGTCSDCSGDSTVSEEVVVEGS